MGHASRQKKKKNYNSELSYTYYTGTRECQDPGLYLINLLPERRPGRRIYYRGNRQLHSPLTSTPTIITVRVAGRAAATVVLKAMAVAIFHICCLSQSFDH